MSVSYRELMALRRAHIDNKQVQSNKPAQTATSQQQQSSSPVKTPLTIREPVRPAPRGQAPVPPGVEPKVFSADVTIRGFVPKVELQKRKAAAFESVNIESALVEQHNIDYFRDGVGVGESFGGPAAGALPLEAFDNTTFEDRSVADWKALIAEVGPLKCVAVRESDDGRGRWADGHVQDWSATEGMLFVAFLGDEGSAGTWIPRIHTYLCSEDPSQFVTRVASAMKMRMNAIGNLRHALYVESMPVDDSQAVGGLVAERIREFAINTERILDNEGALDIPGLMEEVNNDFAKTTNAQLFAHVSENQRSVGQLMGDKKFARPKKAPVIAKEFGQVSLAEKNFPRIVRAFHKNTYLNNQDEVHLTLHRIRDECDHLMRNGIFVLSPQIDGSTPLTLEGFDDMQTTAVLQRALQLKENWCVNVKEHIKDSLQHTSPEDDVNLQLSANSKDAYEGSKLQRLITTVKFQMQDTLFHLVTSSLEAYVMYIERACNFNVVIKDLATVEAARGSAVEGPLTLLPQTMGHDIRPATTPDVEFPLPPPLKAVLQEAHPNSPTDPVVAYTLPTSDFLKVITSVFNKGITAMQEIPQIENQIVNFHLPSQTQTIASISVNHKWAQDWRGRMEVAMSHATKPLDDYLHTYDRFRDLITLDVPTYIKECEERLTKIKELENEVRKHLDRERDILATVPASVNLGTFHVDCVDLRKKLTLKCSLLAQKVLELMAKRARVKAEDVDDKFSTIRAALIRPLETPEDCVRTKEFIKTIPDQVYDLQVLINEMKELDNGLDTFEFALSDDDFSKKWRAVGWPSRLDDEIIRRTHEIEQVKRTLTDGIEKSQVTFAKEVDKLQKTVAGFYKRTDIKKVSEIANEVRGILQDIQKCREQANIFNTHEGLFDREKSDYGHVHALSKDMEAYATLWLTTDDWLQWHSAWTNDPFDTLDAEEVTNNTLQALKNMQKCCREPKFKDKAPILKIAEEIRAQIEDFKPVLPVLRYLRQDGMKDRHWNDLSRELSMELRPGATLHTLQDVYTLDLIMYEQQIMKISEVAAREFDIEKNLASMQTEWADMRLRVKPYKSTGCYIMPKDTVDDTQELLDAQLLTTQALSFSPFRKMFEQEIEQWESNVKLVQAVLDEWKTTQKAWMYLEPIFQSEDIARQLPAESKRFQMVNKNWKYLTGQAHEVDLTMPFCTKTEHCLKLFLENNELLDKVQKGLNQYLENKRSSFARFYFLSDDELLTILSEAKDPQKIQPHFRKLFENVFRIDMRAPDNEMFGMYSQMEEYIPFREPILPRKNVENWLSDIESMMRRSIRYELEKGMKSIVEMGRKEFILNAPGQVAIAINQIFWTANCEKHLIEDGTLEKFVPTANENLMLLVETVRQKLTGLQQMNLGGLITIEVHARDIVETLAEEKVSSVYAFEWVSQLRSYWENNDCYLRQVEAQFVYGGESLGNTTRLVITPLTDRIYLTLTGAMHMFLGSAPAGPAGTGKTETVKDLAKAVAKQCVVFNCQEGMTYASMGKFFKGLANAGAWACFDEFNRIDVEVLSVVAQQVSSLQEAARSGQYRIAFEGTEIVVDPSYSVFITMNPGYAGRTELPDNLKVLFRPVACMVPDYAMIAEIRLFSYGYAASRKLARKMVATFRLSSEQLSSQDHYDFGMRAVNTVISAAGLMKRESPDEDEDVLLLRALRDSNAPKFLKEDLLLFSGIISDLFPGTDLPARDYGNFQDIIIEKCLSNQLQPTELFVKKCVEVFEMSVLRHGQMSVGPAMGGKSCVTRVLKEAMTKLRIELGVERFAGVETYALNPKSITMSQLYGGFDDATGEWRDGLIGELFRIAAAQTSEYRQWIIFDGPVDALWIESMNTVLDENKKLCLISGEIITMSPFMNIMFEVADLAVASPATVSRAGMIYMEPLTCIGIESFIASWQQYRLPSTFEPYRANLQKICEMLFSPLIQFVQTSVTEYSPSTWPNLIQSCFNIFSCFLDSFTPSRTYEVPQDRLELLRDVHMPLLVFSIVWSFGVTGDGASRKKFDRFLRDELRKNNVQVSLPDFGLLHDYEFLMEEKRWVAWTERAPAFTATVNASTYNDIIVPTADVQRYKYINKLLLSKSYHTLCIGPTGTGKSVLISQMLFSDMPEEFTPIFFTFSARTGANQTQDLISSKFEARRRASPQIWGAPVNKKFVVFVDDLNMPMLEQYGAQPPVELLRQFTDYKGWYDRKTREFFHIVDVVLVSAMGPPGGGRNRVTQRFLRHFNQIAVSEIDDANMKIIFSTILDSYFKSGFNDDVKGKLSTLVDSAIEVFDTVTKELRPTPSRPHYLFNLRDLAKIMGGLLDANSKVINSELALAKLFVHETSRTFKDRLVDDHDRDWFDGLLQKQMQKHFKLKWNEIVTTDRLIYVDFAKGSGGEPRVYNEVIDLPTLVGVCEKLLGDYNNLNRKQMNLVMFLDAVEHVCRAARVLKKPSGHLLLLGIGGSGRQSLSRFAAFINELDTFQIELSKGYGLPAWREDLKSVLRKVSFQNKQVMFLVTDTQIVHEGMLEDVNSLLNSGEVPNLFVGPDIDEIMTAMKPICVAEGVHLDKVNMYARFVKFCKTNLHVSVCMSPMGEPFRNRLRMFPALVNCCTIDWFSAWPDQALHSVAYNYFQDVEAVQDPTLVEGCIEMCVHIHQSVEAASARFLAEARRYNYVTPTSYLELLYCFKQLMDSETKKNHTHRNRLLNGLDKLKQTEIQVSELQDTLAQSQPILVQKKEEIERMVEQMIEETAKAEEVKVTAMSEQKVASAKQQECANFEAESQAILDEAMPALEKSLEALGNLQPQQLNEVAGYKVPTGGVRLTVTGLVILFQVKPVMKATDQMGGKKEPDYWQTAKDHIFTNMAQLMANMKSFHKNVIPTISERVINSLTPLIQDPAFEPETVKKTASVACVAMCEWAHAMHKYYFVNKLVQPLKLSLAAAQADSKVAEEKLAAAQARLAEAEGRLAHLQAAKSKAEEDMRELEETVRTTEIKLRRAAMLIDGLAGEKKSWSATVGQLKEREKYLVGDMLCAAGQIAYLGAFTSVYRQDLVKMWNGQLDKSGILHSDKLSVFDTMQDPVQTRQWNLNSLPADTLSTENAIILTNARRWPLMIDPQMQANRWIRDTYGDSLEVVKPINKDYIKKIEHCIRAGRPALLENVSGEIDPSLDPLLNRQTFFEGGQEMIRVSDNAIPWNKDFKFFMTTKLANPHYIPEVMVKVTLLNFFITPGGLEDQLLGVLVGREKKELEDQKVYFVQQNAAMRAQIEDIQRTILKKLEEVKGDILEDESLINYLDQSKTTTADITEKVALAEETEREIDATREGYRSMANHSSILYFCCSQLSNVDPMYHYSLQWFVQLFISSIDSAEKSEDLSERLSTLKDYFTYSFYQNISRSLFEKHKLLFSFVLCIRILQGGGKVDAEEYRFLLQGPAEQLTTAPPNPSADWITDVTWRDLWYLDSKYEAFKGICSSVKSSAAAYRDIFLSASAHRAKLPGDWESKLTPIQRMLFIRCLRPDKLMEAVVDFVSSVLGERFVKPPQFDLATSFKDATPLTPLVFVLSPGADPFEEWKKFAEVQRMSKKLSDISLGQGQGPRAERLFREGMESGMWVLLQNCHLATSWMPTLERLVESMTSSVHPQFRLWLTSMPNPSFPVAILQNGVKMTNEPPKGMRANVSRSMVSYTDPMFERCKNSKVYRKLTFAMCFFHALIQERRKFGPLGWNIPYEYTTGDLNCCIQQIGMFLDKYEDVPYKVIRELSGQIHYGGRVTDDWDRRTITTILETFVKPDVLSDDYAFSASGNFVSIAAVDQKSYLTYVDSWSSSVAPEAFGLHDNADITCARNETFDTLSTIVALQGDAGVVSGGAKSSDETVNELATGILQRVRAPFDIAAFQTKFPTKYEDSMNTVVVQEAIRFNRLVLALRTSLQSIQLAIKGLMVMSKELEELYRAILNNQVPTIWADKAYPSLKPLAGWVSDLVDRLNMIDMWFEKGHPKAYWIGGFYFPQAFLTGILQNYARQQRISIDTISYGFKWEQGKTTGDDISDPPETGCYVYGMYIEGARIDHHTMQLTESHPKVLFEGTPVLRLLPTVDRQQPENVYKCPMYKTLRRAGTLSTTGHSTNYVLTAEIETPPGFDAKHWIKRGVAMICALNY